MCSYFLNRLPGPIGKNIHKKTRRRTTHNSNIVELLYYRWRKNMFGPFELGTVFIKAPLRNAPGSYVEPYVVRLVFLSNSFTKFGVRLYVPAIVLVSLDLFDLGLCLTLHVFLNKVFEWSRVPKRLGFPSGCLSLIGSNSKQRECIHVWDL